MPEFKELLRRLQLDLTGLSNLIRTLRDLPFVRGRQINDVIPAADSVLKVSHGLGRAYTGAIVLYQSQTANPVIVFAPELSKSAGIDITKQLVVGMTALNPGDTAFSLWVF